jgi:hypothetical protein
MPALLTAALALGACAQAPATADGTVAQQAQARPAHTLAPTRELTGPQGARTAREAQLQTPLRLSPEVTGAPPPRFGGDVTVSAPELVAEGADISPSVRVWRGPAERPTLLYGPAPD